MIKILVVDDEPDVQSLFVQRFKKKIRENEWDLVFCQNGCEALEILKKQPDIELVLSDINMPEMDGLTLLGNIKNNALKAKTIMISAYSDMKNIRTAMNHGAFDFITKPINFEDVSATVEKAVEHINILKKAKASQDKLLSLQKELEAAGAIQESILPAAESKTSIYEISARVQPAKEAGGDFYDFFLIDKDHLVLVIADVSGKGISSAVFAVVLQTLVKTAQASALFPARHIEYVNKVCSVNNENCMFATLFYAVLNLKTGEMTYTNAGHNSPYKISLKGDVQNFFSVHDMPLGIKSSASFKEQKIHISRGDSIFLYTDGITEARNLKKEIFLNRRLKTALSETAGLSVKPAGLSILKKVKDFAGQAKQFDDIAYLFCKYHA